MQIIPSILEYSIRSFESRIGSLIDSSRHFQIDIVDGTIDKPTLTTKEALEILTQKNYPNKTFEFHLMLDDPKTDIEAISSFPALVTKIYIHHIQLSNLIVDPNTSFCPTLHPEDEIETLPARILNYPSIQIMTIHPGRQGNPFIPNQLLKVKTLRRQGYTGTIYLDGGIGESQSRQISELEFKPQGIVVGSFLHDSPDQKIAILENIFST